MINAFRSEWVPLLRRRFLLGTLAAVAAVAALGATLTIFSTGRTDFDGDPVTVAMLAAPSGVSEGLEAVTILLGVVALSVTAAALAGEYSRGTLRNQLVAQPHRLRLLAGKCLALAVFVVLVVAVSALVAVGLSFALAPVRGIPTDQWTSLAGLAQFGRSLVNVSLGALGYAAVGALAAVVLRSPAAAIAVGLAYALPVEMLVSRIYGPAGGWLPAHLMEILAVGGTGYSTTYAQAGLRVLLFCTVAALITAVLFRRRDVTA
ncbi:ABC-2 family transporter protein [Frankia sp. EI5c]|uniref:ABC transporter permease subunit n=1 Tax=Frankia sp. EI5c TaxID=683316 RepID=UPI0007C3E481|nr:ABC transporter permease subunit [Frankia sp. EI5c]OAA28836.1 ABC-2 family transporter protein [Frankia sp. EI5c]